MGDPQKLTKQVITEPINTTVYPSWKLYENPFYNSQKQHYCRLHLPLPLSARKIASSLWDLSISISQSIMDSQQDIARVQTQITELKAELEFERKVRKKVESLNKKLSKQVSEEKKIREAMERVCEKLGKAIALGQGEMDRMKREMEEERKMLRIAEVLREERVQMKLMEAKILLEEKLSKIVQHQHQHQHQHQNQNQVETSSSLPLPLPLPTMGSSCVSKRRASPAEAENPHIKRGIKGFVEFPRVVRAISSRSSRQLAGSKPLHCQKTQLCFLLRQKIPIPTDNLITS